MATEYISRESILAKLKAKFCAYCPLPGCDANCKLHYLLDAVKEEPAADVVEVVRKPVAGYECMYEVDNLAMVFSVQRTKIVNDNGRIYSKRIIARQMRQTMHSKGYKVVALTKDGKTKSFFVHRLVAEAFVENPHNLPMVNHKDEDKTNNLPENLEWCDARYNCLYGNGRRKRIKKIVGVPHSEEHKRKISESLKRHFRSRGEGNKIGARLNTADDDSCSCGERRESE
jgi:hypothetical protein